MTRETIWISVTRPFWWPVWVYPGGSMMEVLRSRAARVIGVDEHKPEADLHSFDDIDWDSADIVMTSPVFNPRTPFILEAQRRGIPVYSEVELAWRLRVDSARTSRPAPWVGITGTNGKTSTTEMTSAMLCADGLVAPAVGNIGKAVSHAAVDPDNDALCVELSSFQLHFTDSLALDCAAITNIADDHLDWHGGIEAYAADKSKVFRNVRRALVFNADDRRVSALASAAHTAEGCRRIGFTLGVPQPGQIGVDDGWIVDRSGVAGGAFGDETRLAPVQEFPHLCEPDGTVYPHLLADAMTALALALGMGVDLDKALAALKAFAPGGHRIQTVATAATGDGGSIRFIDDSKATNAHAGAGVAEQLRPQERGVDRREDSPREAVSNSSWRIRRIRLRRPSSSARTRSRMLEAFAASAPGIPLTVIEPEPSDTVMARAVDAAGAYAGTGDVVLMAPACASMDQFVSYADRGTQFARESSRWVTQHGK